MKKMIQSYLSFTRTERVGLYCICGALIILIIIRISLPLLIHSPVTSERDRELAAAWQKFKRSQPEKILDSSLEIRADYKDQANEQKHDLVEVIDLNTADSATLVKLNGIGQVTAGRIVAYRNQHGRFLSIDQLRDIPGFPPGTIKLLKARLVINSRD